MFYRGRSLGPADPPTPLTNMPAVKVGAKPCVEVIYNGHSTAVTTEEDRIAGFVSATEYAADPLQVTEYE